MSLAYLQNLLPRLVREQPHNVGTGDIDRAIQSAVSQFSYDQPRRLVDDFTWGADGHYSASMPPEATSYTLVLDAEWPIGQSPKQTVGVTVYLTETALRLVCEQPLTAAAVVRITYTAEHVVVGGTEPRCTVPKRHLDHVGFYAAHLLCRELATQFSAERESSISADGSNTESRARNYAARSREYRAAYYAGLGLVDPLQAAGQGGAAGMGVTPGASATVSLGRRARPSWRTNDVLGDPRH
jgi:hypothetical protein